MDHITGNGIYGKGEIWRFYTVEEAEQHTKKSDVWSYIIEQMKKYLGKTWLDKKDIIYYYNNDPIYREYKIVGVEDNNPYCDYYWILEDQYNRGNRKYELVNSGEFYKNIKE